MRKPAPHRILPLLAIGFVVFAGCFGGPSDSQSQDDTTGSTGREDANASYAVDPDVPVQQADNGTRFQVYNATGHITADAANLGADQTADFSSATALVPATATAVVAELQWTGDTNDFDLVVYAPTYCPGGGFPTGPIETFVCAMEYYATEDSDDAFRAERNAGTLGPGSLRIDLDAQQIQAHACGEDLCEWQATAWWNVAVDADYTIKTTVFLEGEVPDDYSAFDAA